MTRQYVFQVPAGHRSGLLPGMYCVWVGDTGEHELMFKPEGSSRFYPPVRSAWVEEQP